MVILPKKDYRLDFNHPVIIIIIIAAAVVVLELHSTWQKHFRGSIDR